MGRVREPNVHYDGRKLVQSHGGHKPVRVIIHDTESHDAAGIRDLEGIAEFWRNQGKGYGAHLGIDKDGKVARYVDDEKVAFHTGGRNTGSLGIELIGFARFTTPMWRLRWRQLDKLARWMAWYSTHYGIPLVWDVESGFSTHRAQSRAFPKLTDHTDPGAFFPRRFLMKKARAYAVNGW